MTQAIEKLPDPTQPCPESPGGDDAAPGFKSSPDGFLLRQLCAAGLGAVAQKFAAGRYLDLEEALALSRASLPLLGRLVELSGGTRLSSAHPTTTAKRPATCHACDTSAADLPLDRVALPPESPRQIGQALTDWESFCRTLIALRNEFSPGSAAVSWYPILSKPLDRDDCREGDFTGAEVLRAIALARLILPAEIQVRAPLATLGAKLAQVALHFGASHLGYVALDGQTSGSPLVADPSVLDELTESCHPTTLKEELE